MRPLRDYPLVVNVAVSEYAALAAWRTQAAILGVGTLLVMLCSGLLLKALSKQFRRFAASEAALTEQARELKTPMQSRRRDEPYVAGPGDVRFLGPAGRQQSTLS